MFPLSYTDSGTAANSLGNLGFVFLLCGLVICCAFWNAYWFPVLPGLGALLLGLIQLNQSRAQATLFCGATGGAFFKRLAVLEIIEGLFSLIGVATSIVWMVHSHYPSHIHFVVSVFCLCSCLATALCAFASYRRCKYLRGEGGASLSSNPRGKRFALTRQIETSPTLLF